MTRNRLSPGPGAFLFWALLAAVLAAGILPLRAARALEPERQWGLGTPGTVQPPELFDLASGPGGLIYAADPYSSRVLAFTPEGRFVRSWPGPQAAPGAELPPRGATGVTSSLGNVFVSDAAGRRVVMFSPQGEELHSWRGRSCFLGVGQCFQEPGGLGRDGQGNIYVADRQEGVVGAYVPKGGFLREYGRGILSRPEDVAVDGQGYVYVTDSIQNKVFKFAPGGSLLGSFGEGVLSGPTGIAVDSQGRVLVTDTGNHRLRIFSSGGELLETRGEEGYAPGQMRHPAGVAVMGQRVFVAEAKSGRIQAWAPSGPGPRPPLPPSLWPRARPGDAGARDTKALVIRFGVAVGFTPVEGVTYQVYRHDRASGRAFLPYGEPVTYLGGGNFSTSDRWTEGKVGQSGWRYDATYGYLFFIDPAVAPYEEYYYLVKSSADRWPSDPGELGDPTLAGQPIEDPNLALNAYTVAAAFPPAQTRHGNYTEYTDACTACHGVHSALSDQKLLKGETVTDLCATCHDGTTSKYDLIKGRVRTGPDWSEFTKNPAGPFGTQLADVAGAPCAPGWDCQNEPGRPQLTSVHNVFRARLDASGTPSALAAQVWQAPGSTYLLVSQVPGGASWTNALTCVSCHEPHNRFQNFRLLRGEYVSGDYNLPVEAEAPGLQKTRDRVVVRGASEVLPEAPPPRVDLSWQPLPEPGAPSPYTRGSAASRYLGGSLATGAAVVDFCTVCHRAFGGEERQVEARVTEKRLYALFSPGEPTDQPLPRGSWTESGDPLTGDYRASYSAPGLRGLRLETDIDLGIKTLVRDILTISNGQVRKLYSLDGVNWEDYPVADPAQARYLRIESHRDEASEDDEVTVTLGVSVHVYGLYNSVVENVYGHYRHRMGIPAALARGNLSIAYNPRSEDFLQVRLQDFYGDNLHRYVPLEGRNQEHPSTSRQNEYAENRVVCLTCHVAHGTGNLAGGAIYDPSSGSVPAPGLEVAYRNYLLNLSQDLPDVLEEFNGVVQGRDPVSGYLTRRRFGQIEGVSSVLARFEPFASVCFRCHSAR